MQTTEIVIEILVIGGGLALCLTPLVAYSLGVPTVTLLMGAQPKDLLVVAVTVVYPLGLLWSRLADLIFTRANRALLKDKHVLREDYHDELVRIHIEQPAFGDRLYQVRSLYRIARASTLTFLLGSVTVPLGLSGNPAFQVSPLATGSIVTAMLGAAALSYFTWRHLRCSYLDWSQRANKVIEAKRLAVTGGTASSLSAPH